LLSPPSTLKTCPARTASHATAKAYERVGKVFTAVDAFCQGCRPDIGSDRWTIRPIIAHFDHNLTSLGEALAIVIETPALDDPGKRALDCPMPRQQAEYLDPQRLTHDLNSDTGDTLGPFNQLARVAAVGPQ